MKDKTNMELTSSEMTGLWGQYINDTLACCVTTYFLEKVEDDEVRPIIQWALDTAKENLKIMQEIFDKDDFPLPLGFNEEDVNPQAPRLFSDTFFLLYLKYMSSLAMTASTAAIGLATRPDTVAFHKRILEKALELQDKTRDLMLKQGTYTKPPSISIPDKVDFVEKQPFLAGFFGKKRTLTSIEITNIFLNLQANAIGKSLITGYAQVAENEDIKKFLLRGKQLSKKYIDIFSNILMEEDLPAPMSWDSFVLDSTTKVFSDKLIMYNVCAMIAAGIGNFGMALAASLRRDIGARYASLIPEIVLYAEDGANLMIKYGWLEEPPQADDYDQLIKGHP